MDSERTEVEFLSRKVLCRAWLYRPAVPGSGKPCIVMGHGFGGTREAGLEPYAQKFCSAGYVVLVFDYRHFGASEGQPRQLFSVRRQLQDWASAIAFARTLADVDSKRIILWGTSFSGGHVIVAAAKDGQIAAVSAQCPMMDAFAASLNIIRYAGFAALFKLMKAGVSDRLRQILQMHPLYIPIVAPPGDLAAMSSHDAVSGFQAIAPSHWQNRVCARFVLTIAGYRPISYAGKLICPVLIQVCLEDSVAPPHATFKTAENIGDNAVLKQYECGHFDIYTGALFERASDEQLTFFNDYMGNCYPSVYKNIMVSNN